MTSPSLLLHFEKSDVCEENASTPLKELGVPEIKEPDEAGDILGAAFLGCPCRCGICILPLVLNVDRLE